MITEARSEKFKQTAANRQFDLTVVLENIHDPHNIGAVMRTCDSAGVGEIFIILNDSRVDPSRYHDLSSSKGARKWVNLQIFDSATECLQAVKEKYTNIFATHLGHSANNLYEFDLTGSVALLFGNEHDGVSEEALQFADANFVIPQLGLVQSLNISVACAVSLYEALRQRLKAGKLNDSFDEENHNHMATYQQFINVHRNISANQK